RRYPHWRFGMDYDRLSKGYEFGLSKIYEMVINNDPCYAYLLESNPWVDQKTVMAHVYAHNDFFKNNFCFAHTNRKMMDEMGNHATRVRRLVDRHGLEKVESFIDSCLSLENLIDPYSPFIKRRSTADERETRETEREETGGRAEIPRLRVDRPYMDRYINPQGFLDEQQRRIEEARAQEKRFPESPERDVLLFLLENAPLERWERDLLHIVREEAYYFAPQAQTKVLNEGWASYWHSKIMTERAAEDCDIIDYASAHAGVVSTSGGQLNPYKLGIELLRDIEDRWNKGRFGKEYDECEDMAALRSWNQNLGLGREKIFEVCRLYNDVTFIDTFLTPQFCVDQKFFVYEFKEKGNRWEIVDKQFRAVKSKLLSLFTNFGQPIIEVLDGNYKNRGELLLVHRHEGVDLKRDHAMDTLANLHAVWRRPVHIHTRSDDKGVLLSFDGENHSERATEEP
ncbi:MAG: SpoVR family protein, partial [Myxococcota bacterium]